MKESLQEVETEKDRLVKEKEEALTRSVTALHCSYHSSKLRNHAPVVREKYWSQQVEHMQVLNETGPRVQMIKRPL